MTLPAPAPAAPLAHHHALVTGAGRGIGLSIARRLAADGATLSILGRDRARLDALASELGGAVRHVAACDVADAAAVERTLADIARRQPLTALVNNAGVAKGAWIDDADPALWQQMIGVNLTGTYLCIRAALPQLRLAAHGRIVNIASTAGLIGYGFATAYCAAKHGVVGLTRALAIELASTTITVNAVCPGYTDTDIADEALTNLVKRGKTIEEARATLCARNPQKRLVTPDEVAATVAWLLRADAQSITGQSIAVAGGEVLTG